MSRFSSAVSTRYALLVVSALLLAVAAGIFWRGHVIANTWAHETSVPLGAAAETSADEPDSGSAVLLGLARDAMHDSRLVAPAGSNAFEFYLSVLQLEPNNRAAQDALRESFTQASTEIERTINRRELEEARREIALLREFDSNNFTLSLLAGKLAATRNIVTKQHEAEAERIRLANNAEA
ncbi:MAG: energy transducer TonB [Rhodanobacter sp.]